MLTTERTEKLTLTCDICGWRGQLGEMVRIADGWVHETCVTTQPVLRTARLATPGQAARRLTAAQAVQQRRLEAIVHKAMRETLAGLAPSVPASVPAPVAAPKPAPQRAPAAKPAPKFAIGSWVVVISGKREGQGGTVAAVRGEWVRITFANGKRGDEHISRVAANDGPAADEDEVVYCALCGERCPDDGTTAEMFDPQADEDAPSVLVHHQCGLDHGYEMA